MENTDAIEAHKKLMKQLEELSNHIKRLNPANKDNGEKK